MKTRIISLLLCISLLLASCAGYTYVEQIYQLKDIPEYSGVPYVELNGNVPYFTEDDYTTDSFEVYKKLDYLGRCGFALACVGRDIMPTVERGAIGMVKPTGWQTVKYDWIDGKYLYNRCHLLGYQLTGENANERNLITGTRYMNTEGMLPFENMVAEYVKETDNHVLLRVTPVYEGANLLAHGVVMEALSMEDNGEGVCFNVFCYNVQPGVKIDYKTGESTADEIPQKSDVKENSPEREYILNTNSKRVHMPGCSSVGDIMEKNKEIYHGNLEDLLNGGYKACKSCNPK
ncbi:MAG: DNA/RNA non-specific endonuclease [Clostridia bacterium]|nr:DNA/RNA non-specific endonuclease [Clostridia bacterium]